MATTTLNDHRTGLLGMVSRWDRRQRAQRTLVWLPRAALPGLAAGVALALISRFTPFLLSGPIASITLLLVMIGMGLALAVIWLRDRSPLPAARRFDVLFGLDERVSTALELLGGRIHTQPELAAQQVQDAHLTAQAVRAGDWLPLRIGRADLLTLLGLALALILLLMLPNPQFEALALETAQDAAENAAVAGAADTVRDLTERTAADPNLTDEQRESLLEVLDENNRTLSDPEVSPEEAFAALSDVQSAFQQVSELLERSLSENAASLQAASDALREFAPPGDGQDLSRLERMLQQMEMMRQLAEQMGSQPGGGMSQALSEAGQALEQTGSSELQQAGQSMQNAADAMQAGDESAAQESLQDAQDALEQAADQAEQQQQAQDSAQQGAEQAQQAGEQLNQAQQQGQQGLPGQQSQPSPPQGQTSQQGQAGEEGPAGQQGQQGQQGQNQAQQSQGEGAAQGQTGAPQQGASGEQQGQQPQGQGQQSAQAQGDQAGQLSGSAVQSSGAGAGDNPDGLAQASQSDGPVQAGNQPDGQGESEAETLYAPQRIGGAPGEAQIILEPDTEDAPVVEGEFSANPTGQSFVPYTQVFRAFAELASRNLETGSVPLSLRDVVRSYFTSLEPDN